jgi:hypothetical protein
VGCAFVREHWLPAQADRAAGNRLTGPSSHFSPIVTEDDKDTSALSITPRSVRSARSGSRGSSMVAICADQGSAIQAGNRPRVPSGWSTNKVGAATMQQPTHHTDAFAGPRVMLIWIRTSNGCSWAASRGLDRHRYVVGLCSRPQGLPRGLFSALQARLPPVYRSRSGARRRPAPAADERARTHRLLIIDDWAPEPLNAEQRRDLLEIVDDRYDRGSLLITSQLPFNRWHEAIGEPTTS